MEIVGEIVEEEETHLVNTVEIEEEKVEKEETQLVNTGKTVMVVAEDEETRLVNTVEIEEGIVEKEETRLVNTVETVMVIVEDEETQFVNTLKSMLQTLPPLRAGGCIYRVPYELRRVNEEAYTPMLVSIGPFHHGKGRLQEMDVQKQRYLDDFLNRRPDLDLEYYVSTLKGFEERARNCYTENIDCSSNDFIKMMLLDGCFIVEFLIKCFNSELRNRDDPIIKSSVMRGGIMRDMALLENQLPFFILEKLLDLRGGDILCGGNSFHAMAIYYAVAIYYAGETPSTMVVFIESSVEWREPSETTFQAKHMVDLCLQYYTPTGTKLPPKTEGGLFRIPNASRLHESGVKFTKCTRSGVKSLLDVKFTNGNLEIPSVMFHDYTEIFLRNLIAYEQCDDSNGQYFSGYIHLTDCLIDTPNDVELLTKAGIINNLLGDNEELSQIVNKLSSGVELGSGFYLRRLFEDVHDYCNKPWHAWRAKLRRDYFNTPWTIISVFAAVILLILAFIQSVCSIVQLKG